MAAAAVVVVADLSARVVAVAAAAAVAAVADLLARVVGHGVAAAVSREAVEGPALRSPAGLTATRGSLQQHGGSLQDGGFPSTLARCNTGRRFPLQDLQ